MAMLLYALLALIQGASVALQGVTNAALRGKVGFGLALVVNTAPILAAAIVVAIADGSWARAGALRSTPPALLLGGLYGFAIVGAAILVIPKLGAGPTLMLVVSAQLVAGVLLDQAGAFGLPEVALSGPRLLGLGLMIAGLVIALRG